MLVLIDARVYCSDRVQAFAIQSLGTPNRSRSTLGLDPAFICCLDILYVESRIVQIPLGKQMHVHLEPSHRFISTRRTGSTVDHAEYITPLDGTIRTVYIPI